MVAEIAEDGDLVLVVGPENVKILVHSLFLKAASKPFSAMLSPNWKEGQHILDRDGPVELSLPEDHAEGLKHICAVIHHRNELLPKDLKATVILEIAIMADKYDFTGALRFAYEYWLQPQARIPQDTMVIAASAYLFRNAQAFRELTKDMVLDYSGPYPALSCEEVEFAVEWKVFCKYSLTNRT